MRPNINTNLIMLVRRKLKPAGVGEFVTLTNEFYEKYMDSDMYQDIGNVHGNTRNYNKKTSIADAVYFICINENPFNNKNLRVIVPVCYTLDSNGYSYSLNISSKKAIKYTIKSEHLVRVSAKEVQNHNYQIRYMLEDIDKNMQKRKKTSINWREWHHKLTHAS